MSDMIRLNAKGAHQFHPQAVGTGICFKVFYHISVLEVRANQTRSGSWAQIKGDTIEWCDVGMTELTPDLCL